MAVVRFETPNHKYVPDEAPLISNVTNLVFMRDSALPPDINVHTIKPSAIMRIVISHLRLVLLHLGMAWDILAGRCGMREKVFHLLEGAFRRGATD